MLETIKHIPTKEEFHNEKFFFSYSSMVKLLTDPKQFYKDYILKEREDADHKYLKEGELFHCFVLEPEMFNEKFSLMSAKVPGGGLKDIIDNIYKIYALPQIFESEENLSLEDFEHYILQELVSVNLYQTYVDDKKTDKDGNQFTGDEKRLKKCITYETIEYFNTLCESTNKTVVDIEMVAKAKEKANLVLNNEECQKYLNKINNNDVIQTEVELKTDFDNYKFGLKGIIDCVKIDYENKIIYITDLKTTSKSLDQWYENFETSEYIYWLQVVLYKYLVKSLIKPEELKYWGMRITFTVIDKNNNIYNFPVSQESLLKWEALTKEKLEIANWHYNNHDYDLPYKYKQNIVKL